jgi:predicted nucleic acid-binding Zn ribbon protein
VYTILDPKETESGSKLERGPADARGPLGLRQVCSLLARRQAGRVRVVGRDRTALGRRHGSGPADARGPLELRHVCSLLAQRQARAGFICFR